MKLDDRDVNRRIELVMTIAILAFIVFIGQLVILQVFQYGKFNSLAKKQHLRTEKIQMGRGTIYTSDGKKAALSIKAFSICAEPRKLRNRNATADYLAKQLGMSRAVVAEKLSPKKEFVYIARKVDADRAQAVIDRDIPGISAEVDEKRYYPLKEVGCHIVGFTGTDNTGLEGIELSFEKYLRGKTGIMQIKKDARGRKVMIDTVDIKKGEGGDDLYLTVDSTMQYYAQQELKTAVEKYKGKTGMLVSMDPNTGAILALANYPEYDPNDFSRYSQEARRDRAVTDVFEPGSIFKIITMSAILKERPEAYNDKVFCGNGSQLFFDRYVHDHEKYGWLTVPDVIKYSSNIGMVSLALRVKPEALYKEYTDFGFGKVTGTDLPGEVPGILRPVKSWDNSTLCSIPYGQEVAVTAMQMMSAYAAIANGGYAVEPYVVEKIEKNGGVVYKHKQPERVKILDDGTRQKLVSMLESVTEKNGTGKKAAITGYRVAGKTGTAQKHNPNGKGYAVNKYVCSFIGFLPADKPQVLTLVVIDEPNPIWAYGGDVSAPAFRNLSNMMISYLHVLPGAVDKNAAVAADDKNENKKDMVKASKLPDFCLKQYADAKKFLTQNDIKHETIGFGKTVISQDPAPKETVRPNDTVSIYLGDIDSGRQVKIYMPDVRGFTIRKATEVLSVYGLRAKCTGSGTAVAQDPKPGTAVKKGDACLINFDMKDKT
jgi:cell division protein FtsI (penicillin-binding protein 3)